jgi:hypothetical protein
LPVIISIKVIVNNTLPRISHKRECVFGEGGNGLNGGRTLAGAYSDLRIDVTIYKKIMGKYLDEKCIVNVLLMYS